MNKLDLADTSNRLLGRCLRMQAERIPNDLFVRWNDESWSYGRVNELANASARAFSELGVAKGDTVAYLLDSCPDWTWTTLGLNKLGSRFIHPLAPCRKQIRVHGLARGRFAFNHVLNHVESGLDFFEITHARSFEIDAGFCTAVQLTEKMRAMSERQKIIELAHLKLKKRERAIAIF